MKHEFKDSSILHSCTYNPHEKEMTITFHNGRMYIYCDVDKSEYEALISAPSAGKHFNAITGRLKIK